MKQTIETRCYNFEEEITEFRLRIASIRFKKVNQNSKWEFLDCDYNGLDTNYSFKDWVFLGELSKNIMVFLQDLNEKI